MMTLFLVCALVGSGLLLLSLLGGHDAGPHSLDVHGLDMHGLDMHGLDAHGVDLPGPDSYGPSAYGADLHVAAATAVPGHLGQAASWLSLRSLVSFAAFFGLGGLLASWLDLVASLQLTFALLAGLAVGGFTAFAFRLARLRGELAGHTGSLVGRTGQVLVPPRAGSPGKVLLTAAGQSEQLLARSSDPLTPGDRVLVIAVNGGLLDVKRWDGQ